MPAEKALWVDFRTKIIEFQIHKWFSLSLSLFDTKIRYKRLNTVFLELLLYVCADANMLSFCTQIK